MPRTIPTPLLAHLRGQVLTTALLVTVARADGVTFGLTTANVDLTWGSQVYEAMDSLAASQLRQTASTGVDNLMIAGALSSARITDADLLAGRYDGAVLELFLVNYTERPLVNRVLVATGTLGEVTFADGQYQAEFRSLSQRLQQKVGALTSATCRVKQLFDSECFPGGFNFDHTHQPSEFRYPNSPVVNVISPQVIDFTATVGTGLIDSGVVCFTSGANTGLALEVKTSSQVGAAMRLTFHAPWALPVALGDLATLEQGCDRTFAICTGRFFNGQNFRGEPFVSSNTKLIHWGRR